MGNACDKHGETQNVAPGRRRLSTAYTERAPPAASEEERGLIVELKEQDIVSYVDSMSTTAGTPKAKCVASAADYKSGRRNSFQEKAVDTKGEKLDTAEAGIGHCCMKGLKPESPNQDAWSILRVPEHWSIYGVYDGHGINGHIISNFVKEALPKLLIKDPRFRTDSMPALLEESFQKMQRLITVSHGDEAQFSGTTATVVVHDHERRKLTIASAGDCTAALASKQGSNSRLTGEMLTRDHKPDLPDEKQRIIQAGGRVVWDGFFNYRVAAKDNDRPGLNMSRCLGDLYGHNYAGLSCVPEVSERTVQSSDIHLFVCSDGVWEFMKTQEAVDIVGELGSTDPKAACHKVAKEAWDRWIAEEGDVVDDITALIINLQV